MHIPLERKSKDVCYNVFLWFFPCVSSAVHNFQIYLPRPITANETLAHAHTRTRKHTHTHTHTHAHTHTHTHTHTHAHTHAHTYTHTHTHTQVGVMFAEDTDKSLFVVHSYKILLLYELDFQIPCTCSLAHTLCGKDLLTCSQALCLCLSVCDCACM